MCPVSRGTSRSTHGLQTGEAKLWILLVGVNQYRDERLPSLRYSVPDCQGLGEALAEATQEFPNKEVIIHHDFAPQNPNVERVRTSLRQIIRAAKPLDTVLFYFSGHGMLEPQSQQAVLCLADTQKDNLLATGLGLPELLEMLGNCTAHQQLVWLDACHSGGMTLRGARSEIERELLLNPTPQLVAVLQRRAAQSKGFYALLSCDHMQQSWEFPELGHGVFTYYLMRGLRGEAADSEGAIEADGLYKYVYHQTLRYIDRTNKQLRLINQQKRSRGETHYLPPYPLQTPKRIVEGVGELLLGLKLERVHARYLRQALVVEGLPGSQTSLVLSKKLRGAGAFELEYWPRPGKAWSEVRDAIQAFLCEEAIASSKWGVGERQNPPPISNSPRSNGLLSLTEQDVVLQGVAQSPEESVDKKYSSSVPETPGRIRSIPHSPLSLPHSPLLATEETPTILLYLRGRIEETEGGEASLVLGDNIRLSRSWLRQQLRRSALSSVQLNFDKLSCCADSELVELHAEVSASRSQIQQIVVLDCPGATSLLDWVDDLQLGSEQRRCLIAAAAPPEKPELFAQALVDTLTAAPQQVGLSIAEWIAQLEEYLAGTEIALHWRTDIQGAIDILPGRVGLQGLEATADFDIGLCPYMGLKAFGEEQAQYFYGRKPLTQKLINELSRRAFLAVVGASGSGKSSVVQAGLMAQLRQGKQLPGSDRWWLKCFRPGANPIKALVQQLLDTGTHEERAYQFLQLEGLLYLGVEGFVQWLRNRPEPMVVLVVDQCEELFTLAQAEERQRFLEIVLGAVEYAADRFKLVITLRTDFIAAGLEMPKLAKALQEASLLVPPYLTEADYRQVIVKPAEKVGLQVEPELIEVMLQELNYSTGDLPLLEFVLEQLWEHRQAGELKLQAYQQKIGGIKGALERKAQAVYESLDPQAQDCARWIFLSLTQLGEGTEDTRRRVLKSELVVAKYSPNLVEKTLQTLTAAKLVVIDVEGNKGAVGQSRGSTEPPPEPEELLLERLKQEATVEVAHEVLIRHWSTLRWWLEENRARLRLTRQIEQAATLWKQRGQQSDFLLRGVRLAEAEDIYIKYTDELSEDVQKFIEACLEERQQQQLQVKRRLKRTQTAVAVISILGVAALGFGGLAYLQGQKAAVSEIEALNSSSEALLSDKSLEALIAAVKAGKQLQQQLGVKDELKLKTAGTLQQAIYETHESNRLEGHSSVVQSVRFSPDRQLIATASWDKTVRLWKADGTFLRSLSPHNDKVMAASFSPDSKMLASASLDGKVRLWRVADGKLLTIFAGHGDGVSGVSFSPDGQTLASASYDKTVKLWRVADGQLLRTFTGHQDRAIRVSFSPNGQMLASASLDKTVKLWQMKDGKLLKTFTGHQDKVSGVSFSPDSKIVASASLDGTVHLWRTTDSTVVTTFGEDNEAIADITFSLDGQTLATASDGSKLRLWRVADGKLLETLKGHSNAVTSVSFGWDGKTLASASADKIVKLWSLGSNLNWHDGSVDAVSFSPDGKTFASASFDTTVKLWNAADGTLRQTLQGHSLEVKAVSFSPNGRALASASADKTVKLWSLADRRVIKTLTGHSDIVTDVAFSPNSKILASSSADKTVKLWNLADNQPIRTLTGHDDWVTSIAFSPNGEILASASRDKTIKLWRVIDGTLIGSPLTGHRDEVASVRFSPDGKILATGSADNTIRLWRVADGKPIAPPLVGHDDRITSISFSPDGKTLASGSSDRTIKLWSVANGTPIKTLVGHQGEVTGVSFSPNGKALLSASQDTTVIEWNLELSDLLRRGCDRLHDYLKTNPNVRDRWVCDR